VLCRSHLGVVGEELVCAARSARWAAVIVWAFVVPLTIMQQAKNIAFDVFEKLAKPLSLLLIMFRELTIQNYTSLKIKIFLIFKYYFYFALLFLPRSYNLF
jgi:hypothetical protein